MAERTRRSTTKLFLLCSGNEYDYPYFSKLPAILIPHGQSISTLMCGNPKLSSPYDHIFEQAYASLRQQPRFSGKPDLMAAWTFRRLGKPDDLAATINITAIELLVRNYIFKRHRYQQRRWLSVRSLYLVGNFWRLRGNMARALQCFRTVLAVRPEQTDTLHALTLVLDHMQLPNVTQELATLLPERIRHPERVGLQMRRQTWRSHHMRAVMSLHAGDLMQTMRNVRWTRWAHPCHHMLDALVGEVRWLRWCQFGWHALVVMMILVSRIRSICDGGFRFHERFGLHAGSDVDLRRRNEL